MENTPGRITQLSSDTAAASSEEVRALITVLWEISTKLDRVLSLFDKQSNDPRYSNDIYRPR
jgi:hypothetical protein